MPNALDHALFVVLAVLFPVRAAVFGFRRIGRASPEERPRVRVSVYRQAIAIQWGLAFATVALWIACRREWDALGLVPRPTWGLGGVLVGTAIMAGVVVRQRRQTLADDDALARLRRRMEKVEPMLPHTRADLVPFLQLSLTAGICEELLYRGYLIWYLSHWLTIYPAAALASLLFGVGHLYQGWRGVLTTGMVGAFLASVYLVSGSLFAGMALHALMDAHSGSLMQAAYERAPAEAAEPA
ncbi:MAG TPA: CPBP family intramembrane glutamic endopeptidase [Candidatus Eisenbacteria bacterium]|jgi:membrane protease YdiL (CAAX protease family)